eukprot:5257143-Amphidinium_carterae.1
MWHAVYPRFAVGLSAKHCTRNQLASLCATAPSRCGIAIGLVLPVDLSDTWLAYTQIALRKCSLFALRFLTEWGVGNDI